MCFVVIFSGFVLRQSRTVAQAGIRLGKSLLPQPPER